MIKMAATHDKDLFARLESEGLAMPPHEMISAALRIKRQVVEADEKETGLRRVLNFGHTIGHGIESRGAGKYLHGECVALGMLPMCAPHVRERLLAVFKKVGLPTSQPFGIDMIWDAITHDKKMDGDEITYVWVDEIGTFDIRHTTLDTYRHILTGEVTQ